MTKTPSSHENASGLHRESGPQQGDLRDERQGTYDPVGKSFVRSNNPQTSTPEIRRFSALTE